ncbi:MAG: hypothetical protein MK073_01610 [Phycisphaerales bacterium]|nr:hypothetical protein [Phycisphaerales bacterium]
MPNFSQTQQRRLASESASGPASEPASSEHRNASMVLLLLISFVIGLCLSTVTWGDVLFVDESTDEQELTLPLLKSQVENALGLPAATVQASFERPQAATVPIPWRNQMVPVIRIALPQRWVSERASMQGSQFIVLEEVKHIAMLAVPSARIELQVVPQTPVLSASTEQPMILGKHAVVLFGLTAMFFATYMTSRRKSNVETVSYNPLFDATSEANRILQMDYVHARQALDRLQGNRRQEVLHHIASHEEELMPIVEVSTQKQHATV